MTVIRKVRYMTSVQNTLTPIWNTSTRRRAALIVVITDGSVFTIGPSENCSATNGLFVPIKVPIYFGKGGLDPTQELYFYETAGSKVITVMEDLCQEEHERTADD